MKIIVLLKQVPDTNQVKIDPKTGTLIRQGVPSIINPDDKFALEGAVRLKEEFGGTVTILSMGPPQAKDAIMEGIAMGADDGILLSDRMFAGADTWATSYSLSQALKKIGDYDIIFAGRQATDGDTAQIGPQTAEALDIPQVTYVYDVQMQEDGKTIRVKKAMEDGYEVLDVPLPALLTCIKDLNVPRYPSISGIQRAVSVEIPVWSAADVDAEPEKIGLKGSPTMVAKTFTPEPACRGDCISGTCEDVVTQLINKLQEINILKE
jgi:electron transfer flavoprotein alpha/beta subunit